MINQISKRIFSFIIPILYLVIICPVSLLLRFMNKKIIPINFDKNKNSYWVVKRYKKSGESEDFYKQY